MVVRDILWWFSLGDVGGEIRLTYVGEGGRVGGRRKGRRKGEREGERQF